MKLLFALVAVATGCTTVATSVAPNQTSIPDDSGVAFGRLGFVARKKISLRSFELAAVQVPDGDKFWIRAASGAASDGEEQAGSFFVTLPSGHYRLTQWVATAAEGKWAGEDAGLSIEVTQGQAVCVGALYLHPLEKQLFQLDPAQEPPTLVRDECADLAHLLRQRSPAVSRSAVVKVARPVTRRKS